MYTMASNDLAHINIGKFLGRRTLPNSEEVGTLVQAVNNHQYGFKSLSFPWQVCDDIHGHLLPFLHENLQGL